MALAAHGGDTISITMTMRLHKISVLVAAAALALALGGCRGKQKEDRGPQKTEFEQGMKSKDTLAVTQLVDRFFGYVKAKDFAEAAGMLYRNDRDRKGEPQQLDNEEMADVRAMLESVPMVSYRIEYIKFDEYYQNEVLCRVVIKEAQDGMPEISTKMFFKPVNYLGNWVLCLTNSAYGDRGVVSPDKRDSLEKAYARQKQGERK